MVINLIIIFFTFLVGLFFSHRYKTERNSDMVRKKYIKIVCFALILQSGLRNVAVGDDTYGYYVGFEEVKQMSWKNIYDAFFNFLKFDEGKDPGYLVFQKIFQIFSDDYQVFLFFIAVLFFSAFGYFLYKNTTRLRDVVMAFVIYSIMFYTFYSFTGIRQTIVTAFVLFSYFLLRKKRHFIWFFIIIISISFIHKSVLIFLPFALFTLIKRTKLLLWTSLLSFPVLFVFSGRITTFFTNLSESYSEYEHYDEYKPTTLVVLLLLIALLAVLRHDKIIASNKNARFYFVAFSFAVFFLSFVYEIHGYLRLVQYFSFFMVLLIPEILNSFESISKKVKNDITIFAMVLLLSLHLKANLAAPIKYAFFWQEMRLGEHYYESD